MMPPLPRLFLSALAAAAVILGLTLPAGAQPTLTVFAAASLKSSLDEIAADFEKSGHSVQISYGGSSTLARQIQYGAPAQVFISANTAWMDVLEQDGMLVAGTRRDLLTNRLVLIAGADTSDDLTIKPGFDLAATLGRGRLAMALVDAVPAGIYGRAALQSLDIWQAVAPKVAQVDNVRAALMLVAIGEAPYGIVYATDAMAEPRVRIVGSFPADSHPPILYPAAAIAGPDPAQGQVFLDFLESPQASAIFRRHGFGLAEDDA